MAIHLIQPGAGDEDAGNDLSPLAEINVTPFVDVMLVLLIVFMVTAPLMMLQMPIELPRVSAEAMEKPAKPIVLVLDKQRRVFIDDQKVARGALFDRLKALNSKRPQAVVYVGADKGVPYGEVLKLLSTAGVAGFAQVSLLSEAPSQAL
jgi:biopolymer transport protein TolR